MTAARSQAGPKVAAALDGVEELDENTEDGITIHPRADAKTILDSILASPTRQLRNYINMTP